MKNKLKRYFWLIDVLRDSSLSLKELSNRWNNSLYNDNKTELSRRTFQEHKNAINNLNLGVKIVYNHTTRKYTLSSDEDNENMVAKWMWNTMSLQSAISNNVNMKDRIIVDDVSSAHLYLDIILRSLRTNQVICFSYCPFGKTSFNLKLHPYFVQMTGNRWYVFGRKDQEEIIKAYALDRMENVKTENETFTLPHDFSAQEYLLENGIGQYKEIPIVKIVIRAYGKQVYLLRTLPLHSSQEETKTEEGKSEFTYSLRPTSKFYGDILSRGKYVKILSPSSMRIHMRELINNISRYY